MQQFNMAAEDFRRLRHLNAELLDALEELERVIHLTGGHWGDGEIADAIATACSLLERMKGQDDPAI